MKKLFTYLMLMVGMLLPMAANAADLKADLTIYYDVSDFGDFSGKKLQAMIGHSSYSTTYEMKAVEGYDNLYSLNIGEVNSGAQWGGATQLGFMAADAIWGGESNGSSSQPNQRIKWAPMYTGIYNISSTLSGNVLFTGKTTLSITQNYELPAKAPLITITSALPEFPTTTVGQTSTATVTYSLENADAATVTVTGDGFSAEDAAGTITVTFAPEAAGEFTGVLTITAGDVSQEVELSATATEEVSTKPEILNVSELVFETITEGDTTTATVSYTLVNADYAAVSVAGEGFSIVTDEPGLVTIQFAPEAAGTYSGTLMISVEDVMKQVEFSATATKAPVIVTIGFVNPEWTNANLYAWGADGLPSSWPGLPMTKGENGKFTYDLTIPENGEYNFIINDGNGVQSVDMAGVTESTCYNLGAKSGEKYTLVVSENCDYTPAPEPEPIDPYVAIRGTMTNWDMANDIKMTYNADAANGPEWYITAFEVPADGKFKVVSVDAQSQATWYGSDKVDLQEGITNAGQGDGDIELEEGAYDIYFKVNEGRMWIQKYAPAPEPVDPVINVIVADFTNNTTEVGDQADASIVYSLENAESATVTIEGEYVTFQEQAVEEGTMIAIFFTPEEAGEFPGKVIITTGEVTEEIEFTFIATEPEDDPIIPDPENLITFTVQVPEGTIECWVTGSPLWEEGEFLPMERVEGEENMFTVTTTKDVLDGTAWKYCSGADWAYVERTAEGGDVPNRTEAGNPDVVAKWALLYDPDAEPIEPYYGIRGLVSWDIADDVKLTENTDGSEWYIQGLEVDGTQEFKVIEVDESGAVLGWYGVSAVEPNDALGEIGTDNIVLAAGKYDIYFKVASNMMWIQPAITTDAEEAISELIYAIDGTIIAPAPFAIIDLSGKDVTNANGSLEGTYLVKTLGGVTKISVK